MGKMIEIICNPSSGKQKLQENIKELKHLLSEDGHQVEIIYTEKKGHGEILSEKSALKNVDLLIAVGGDGTLNEVVNGLMKNDRRPTLAIYPTGTVNDYGTYLQIPRRVKEFYEMINRGRTVMTDVGKANDRYFINVAAGGTITEVAHNVSCETKTLLGKTAYFLEGAREVPRQIFKAVELTYKVEEEENTCEALFFLVANTKYVGGFRHLMKRAEINDGKMDLLIVEKMPAGEFLNLFVRALGGYHLGHPKIIYKKVRGVEIKGNPEMEIDIDGEYLGKTPVKIDIFPQSIKVVIP